MYCKHHQHGFSLPVAIFILVIMALLGAGIVSIMQSSQESTATEVLSTRAFFAAESGAQVALGQLFDLSGGAVNCAASYPAIDFNATGLGGCSASATCSSSGIGTKTYFTITSTGSCNVSGYSAVREIQIMAATP